MFGCMFDDLFGFEGVFGSVLGFGLFDFDMML